MHLKGLDNASNGDLNFGESTLDLIKKTCIGSVYEVSRSRLRCRSGN